MPKSPQTGRDESPVPSLLDNTVVNTIKPSFATRVKVTNYGKMLDVEQFDKPIRVGIPPKKPKQSELTDAEINMALNNPELFEAFLNERTEEYRKRTACVAKTNIRRLVQANFDKAGKFLTLTIRPNVDFDRCSLTESHSRFASFITRLRAKYKGFKYLTTPELQKSGAVHFHVVNDLPFVPIEDMRKLWPHGFIKLNRVDNPAYIGSYIAKYISKSVSDPRFNGHHLYYCSRGLIKPKVRYGEKYLAHISALHAKGIKPVFQKEIQTEKNGKKILSSYNFYQLPAQNTKEGNHGSD